jgi:hypothetical protein
VHRRRHELGRLFGSMAEHVSASVPFVVIEEDTVDTMLRFPEKAET